MIKVLVVDDHPALRAGLHTVLSREPGLVPVASAAGKGDVGLALASSRPDLVLLDYHLSNTDGMVLCHRIKNTLPTPRVILFSAYADASMTVPATLAGADAVLSKSVPAEELYSAIRAVAAGECLLPAVSPGQFSEASVRLADVDLQIFTMAVDRAPPREIADALGLEPDVVTYRVERMLHDLRVRVT